MVLGAAVLGAYVPLHPGFWYYSRCPLTLLAPGVQGVFLVMRHYTVVFPTYNLPLATYNYPLVIGHQSSVIGHSHYQLSTINYFSGNARIF